MKDYTHAIKMMRITASTVALLLCLSISGHSGPTLSSDIRRLMPGQESRLQRVAGACDEVCAFVRLKDRAGEQQLAQEQCEVIARIGDILIANIPLRALPTLAKSEYVDRIETHLGGRRTNDLTQEWVHTTPLHQGESPLPQAYNGEHVLVGIVDIGLDVSHPTFLSADGSHSRVVGMIDQYADETETIGVATPLGREYLTPDDIAAKQHSADVSQTHGTHCLGTAAGSGYGTPYAGVAYGADLFAIASKGVMGFICSANEVAMMKRIFDYADEHGQPCVISYSVGFDYIYSDAELFSEAFSQLTGPGHIIAASAGNSGDYKTYVEKQPEQPHAGSTLQLFMDYGRVYLKSDDEFRLKCIVRQGDATGYVKGDSLVFDSSNLPDGAQTLGSYTMTLRRDSTFYTFEVSSSSSSNYSLMMLIEDTETSKAHVVMYTSIDNQFAEDLTHDGRFDDAVQSHGIGIPGSLPCIVTIGALNCRPSYVDMDGEEFFGFSTFSETGTLAYFSSQGPTLDGMIKPDAVAPGVNIISSGNSFSTISRRNSTVGMTSYNGRDYPWLALSGTSMACPAAAGIIALWLQANPLLTPDDVKATLAVTSTHPEPELTYPNNSYGHGLINAYAGMLHVLGLDSSVPGLSMRQPSRLHISGDADGTIRLQLDTPSTHPLCVKVYSVSGELVESKWLESGMAEYQLHIPSRHGVYAIDVSSDEPGIKGSQLVRI